MVSRRVKALAIAVVVALALSSTIYVLYMPGHTGTSRFSASFSDMQSYNMSTNSTFEAKVASTDFTMLPVGLGQNRVSLGFSPKDTGQVTNLTVLDVFTGHVYYSISGSDIGLAVNTGVAEIKSRANSNVTILTNSSNLSGPHAGASFGFAAFTPSNFQVAIPNAFEVNLDPVANFALGSSVYVNETLSISEGNKTVAVGSTTTGTTIRVSSATGYRGQINSPMETYIIANDVSMFTYVPRSYTILNAGPPFASVLTVEYPFGRMNISSGSRTFLGVEKLKLNGTVSDLEVSNKSGRFRMTVDGLATYVMVDGTDITKTSWTQFIEENQSSLIAVLSLIVAVASLIVSLRRSRRNG